MLKKRLFLLLASGLLLMGTNLRGQRFQEPQWEMPFYFEDALGQRDTIWIGYDPSASMGLWQIDPQFDEGWKWIDTTQFNVYLTQKDQHLDSVIKRHISSWPYRLSSYGIGVTHGQLPVVMKWNDPLLDSDKLSNFYPAIPDRPRARIDIHTSSGSFPTLWNGEPYFIFDVYPTVICSGYEGFIYPFAHFRDSLIFTNEGYCPPNSNTMADLFVDDELDFYISPFYYGQVGIVEESNVDFGIYPNPTTGIVHIQNDQCWKLTISVFELSGKQLMQSKNIDFSAAIDITGLSNGVYILRIDDGSTISNHKVVKQ